MTIKRGEEWGTTVARPADLTLASGDADLARLVTADPTRPLGVSAGDLHRAVGSPAPRDPVQRLPMDALVVTLDDRTLIAVAHVVAMASWWRGRIVAVMNCDHVGEWDVAPRAHPNDGRFDVVEVDPRMGLRRRIQARSRLPHGTHVPHPDIATRVATGAEWTFERPTPVRVDGVACGRVSRLHVAISADHFSIHA
jgi:hypothetical protein